MDLLSNIIIGINELYVCKCLLDLDLTLMNIWRDNYYLESDYDSKTKLSIIFLFAYITTHNEVGARLCFYMCLWFCPQLVAAAETRTVGKRAVRILLECFLV